MIIQAIDKINVENDSFVKLLLHNSVMNDYVFERSFFIIHLIPDDITDVLYRRLYEDCYYRMTDKSGYKKGVFYLNMTVSEAIGFIRRVTPPILQDKIPEAIRTVESIYDLLRLFLMEDNKDGQHQYYLSEFKKYMYLNEYPTQTNYNTDRTSLLRMNNKDGITTDVEIYSPLVDGFFSGNIDNDKSFDVQIMFHFKNKNQIKEVCENVLQQFKTNKVLNVFSDNENGYYLEMYFENFNASIYKWIMDLIKFNYKDII